MKAWLRSTRASSTASLTERADFADPATGLWTSNGCVLYCCNVTPEKTTASLPTRKTTSGGAQRPKYQVFISSTYTDLKEVRSRVTWAVLETQNIPAGMEVFPSTDDRGWKTIKRVIDQSDYYVLLLAGRYGSYDDSINMSWTHREYRYAREQRIPVLAFKRADSHIAKNGMETNFEQQKRLSEFICEVGERHKWTEWLTADDLATKVNTSLFTHIEHDREDGLSRPGWFRGEPVTTGSAGGWPLQPSAEIRAQIQRALQNAHTNLHAGRILRVISSWGTVGYRGLGSDGKTLSVYHATGKRSGVVYTARLGIGYVCRDNWVSLEGILGFPSSDEFPTSTGAQVDFEGGRAVWVASSNEVQIWSDVIDGGRMVKTYTFRS